MAKRGKICDDCKLTRPKFKVTYRHELEKVNGSYYAIVPYSTYKSMIRKSEELKELKKEIKKLKN